MMVRHHLAAPVSFTRMRLVLVVLARHHLADPARGAGVERGGMPVAPGGGWSRNRDTDTGMVIDVGGKLDGSVVDPSDTGIDRVIRWLQGPTVAATGDVGEM